MSILDLCCGRGGGLNYLKQNYKIGQAVGLDISPQQILFAQRKFTKSEGLDFNVGDVEHLVSDHPFDLILLIESLIYLSDLDSILRGVQ